MNAQRITLMAFFLFLVGLFSGCEAVYLSAADYQYKEAYEDGRMTGVEYSQKREAIRSALEAQE